jgi:hypothetical protein
VNLISPKVGVADQARRYSQDGQLFVSQMSILDLRISLGTLQKRNLNYKTEVYSGKRLTWFWQRNKLYALAEVAAAFEKTVPRSTIFCGDLIAEKSKPVQRAVFEDNCSDLVRDKNNLLIINMNYIPRNGPLLDCLLLCNR